MLRYIIVLNVLAAYCTAKVHPATKGEVWPKPQQQVKTNRVLKFDHRQFQIKVVGVTCPLLSSVVARYSHIFVRQSLRALNGRRIRLHASAGRLNELHVNLTSQCEDYPHYGMDESYDLTISEVSSVKSASIWGIMRGLQTALHLLYFSDNYKEILVNATKIVDYPRFSHRGLLIDTSRHYISLQNILLTLDAMEMNKMNVLHWHIVDDESFPYQSKKFPELSEHGAYYPTMVYSKADIELVLKYARERGIRVLPEFDVPGHTLSWGASHPEIIASCIDEAGNPRAVLNPISKVTYDLLEGLIQELNELFPEKYFHVGGDEVYTRCWNLDPSIDAYMIKHNKTVSDLFHMFMEQLFVILGDKSQPVVWQEVFSKWPSLPAETPVHIWLSSDDVNEVLEAGKQVILSQPWYLDHLDLNWRQYYSGTDPAAMVKNKTLISNVLGGEACMWGESVDDRNIISRVWPRASAIAEVLWSSPPFDIHVRSVSMRLEEHTCRMIRHDIGAQPATGAGFCVVNPNHF